MRRAPVPEPVFHAHGWMEHPHASSLPLYTLGRHVAMGPSCHISQRTLETLRRACHLLPVHEATNRHQL